MNTVNETSVASTAQVTVKTPALRGRKPRLQVLNSYLLKNGSRLSAEDLDKGIEALTKLRQAIVIVPTVVPAVTVVAPVSVETTQTTPETTPVTPTPTETVASV